MVRRNVAMVTLALLAAACHTITEELPQPSQPSQVVTGPAPIPVVVIPVPAVPTPPPAAAPTPEPHAPQPTPRPAPPSGGSCRLGNGNGSGNGCPYRARVVPGRRRAGHRQRHSQQSLAVRQKQRPVPAGMSLRPQHRRLLGRGDERDAPPRVLRDQRRQRARGQELELLQRPIRHHQCRRVRPARHRVVSRDLLSRLVLSRALSPGSHQGPAQHQGHGRAGEQRVVHRHRHPPLVEEEALRGEVIQRHAEQQQG